jgi:hypothetical protein
LQEAQAGVYGGRGVGESEPNFSSWATQFSLANRGAEAHMVWQFFEVPQYFVVYRQQVPPVMAGGE